MTIVVDSSAIVPLGLPDEDAADAEAVLRQLASEWAVATIHPSLTDFARFLPP